VAGEAAVSGLRFFLDRGLGAFVVPRALRAAGWTLETMDERYGADQSQHIQDTQWIEEATLVGDVLLCKDLAIAQNPPGGAGCLHDQREGVRPVECSGHGACHGAVVPGQRGEDRQDRPAGQRAVRYGGEPDLRPAPSETGLPARMTLPVSAESTAVRVKCTANAVGCLGARGRDRSFRLHLAVEAKPLRRSGPMSARCSGFSAAPPAAGGPQGPLGQNPKSNAVVRAVVPA
jgi:hypothetical protein